MAHTLTFTDIEVTVNGFPVPSPYTLQNGDKIVATDTASNTIRVNGTTYSSNTTISLQDTDINISLGVPFQNVAPIVTINYTETPTVSRKSIDLTTLPGWSSLADGSHSITIVAKADGYIDSEPSTGVTVTKAMETPTDCIVFTGESSDFTLTASKEWDGTVEYSTDRTTWTTWDGTAISSSNKKLYLRGSGNTTFYANKGTRFVLSAKAGCSGNLNTLLEYSNPPTVLSKNRCYDSMFYGCTSLTTAPALPATMLSGERCYGGMFYGCTSLTTAPALPATTLATHSYRHMFSGCSSFKVSSTQTGTYQYEWRIPTSGTMSSTGAYWSQYMLKNTGGTFTSDPSANTTYYVENEPV